MMPHCLDVIWRYSSVANAPWASLGVATILSSSVIDRTAEWEETRGKQEASLY